MGLNRNMKQYVKKFLRERYGVALLPVPLPTGANFRADLNTLIPDWPFELIVDVGANIGQTATMYSNLFPDARIICFEPDTNIFGDLQANVSDLPSVNCECMALGNLKGKQQLFRAEVSKMNSLCPPTGQEHFWRPENSDEINVETLDSYCESNAINKLDLLKVDTEGFDIKVLEGGTRLLERKKIKCIITEVGVSANDELHVPLQDSVKFLHEFGYSFCGLYDQIIVQNPTPDLACANALFIC